MNHNYAFHADFVFCIDVSCNMNDHIQYVKDRLTSFYDYIFEQSTKRCQTFDKFRVALILFQNFKHCGENAILKTKFLELPEELETFHRCIDAIETHSGLKGAAQDGLEAIAYAIHANWNRTRFVRHRHVIVVYSNSPINELGTGAQTPQYPAKMAKDFTELSEWWGNEGYSPVMDSSSRYLVIHAQEEPHWNMVNEGWENVLYYSSLGLELSDSIDREIYSGVLFSS